MLSIDQTPDRGAGTPVTSFSLDGSNIQFAVGGARRGRKAGRCPSTSGVPLKRRHGSTPRRIAHNSSR